MKVYWIEPGDWECATTECLPNGSEGVAVIKASEVQALLYELERDLKLIEDWTFGYDGDCGVKKVAESALAKFEVFRD